MMHGRGQALCLTHSGARGTISLSYQEDTGQVTVSWMMEQGAIWALLWVSHVPVASKADLDPKD